MMISPKKRANAISKADEYFSSLLKDIEDEKLRLTKENLASVGIESQLDNIDISLLSKLFWMGNPTSLLRTPLWK